MELPTPRELELEALLRRRDEELARVTVRHTVLHYVRWLLAHNIVATLGRNHPPADIPRQPTSACDL